MDARDVTGAEGRTPTAGEAHSGSATIDGLVADLYADSAEFARVLEVAAIPRLFDEDLLADLLGTPSTDEAFQECMRWLTRNPFVHERLHHSWALHDRVRGPLLDRWSHSQPDELAELLARLEDLYVERYAEAQAAFECLAMTEDLIRKASVNRYWQLAEILEDQLVRAAVESVHTAVRRSFHTGWGRMVSVTNELINRSQFQSCEVVVRAWFANEAVVEDADHEELKAWGAYFMAHAKVSAGHPQEALDTLDALGDPREVGLKFATWHFGLRATALRGLNRFDEALEAMDAEIAIHDEHHVDDVNIATPWTQKADLYQLLKRTELQTVAAEEALQRATELSTPSARVNATLSLARARDAAGDEQETAHWLMQAMSKARLMVGDSPDRDAQTANKNVLDTGIATVGLRSSRLLVAWGEQLRQLRAGDGPGAEFDLLLHQAETFARAGHTRVGAQLYERARRLIDERLPERRAEMDAEEAYAASFLGKPRLGAELNLSLLEQDTSTPAGSWDRSRWLTNAANNLLDAGDYARGLELIPPAIEGWKSIGVHHAISATKAIEGELLRCLGDFQAAEAALDEAVAVLEGPVISTPHAHMARLRHALADYDRAADHALASFEIAQKVESRGSATKEGLFAVQCLVDAGRIDEAVGVQEQVGEIVSAMSRFAAWGPSESSELADRHAGRALRILVSGFGPLDARARSAIEHLELATTADDALGWYHAELGWAYVLLDNPKQARRAFASAVEKLPTKAMQDAMKTIRDELS